MRWGFSLAERRNTALLACSLEKKLGKHLRIPKQAADLCKTNRDALDSIIASLIARASACGLCDPIPYEHSAAAQSEGWIALPLADSFHKLFNGEDYLIAGEAFLKSPNR
jgi:hypothetical protein